MARFSSFLWILALTLGVTLAPQLRDWTWGPTMLVLAAAMLASLPVIWKAAEFRCNQALLISGIALALWISIRAIFSPVLEFAMADLFLLAMAVATFLVFRSSISTLMGNQIMHGGICLLLLASVVVVGKQILDPTYSPIFPNNEPRFPSGFYSHYSYGASFLIPAALLVMGWALAGRGNLLLRILYAIVSVAGMVAVYFTNSRGGLIGLWGGAGVLLVLFLFKSSGNGSTWARVALLSLPFMLIGGAALTYLGLSSIQESRSGSGNMLGLLDSQIRLHIMSLAVSSIGLHPWIGGGARSFSWECYRFWDTASMGWGRAKPEHVHNELLQTATDYGLIGAGLLVILLVAVAVTATLHLLQKGSPSVRCDSSPWVIGGAAALSGLLVQSFFEGIFRLPAGAMLLGLSISAATCPLVTLVANKRSIFSLTVLTGSAVFSSALLGFYGVKSSQTAVLLWPAYFTNIHMGMEARLDRLTKAIAIWPIHTLMTERASLALHLYSAQDDREQSLEFLQMAYRDFRDARLLNPYSPEIANSLGYTAGLLEKDSEASAAFQAAVRMQGEMEPTFHSRFLYSQYLIRKGLKDREAGSPSDAAVEFELAVNQINRILSLFVTTEVYSLRVLAYQNLGMSQEEAGDHAMAQKTLQTAAGLPVGESSHYLLARFYGRRAVAAWSQRRSSDALKLFMMAEQHGRATEALPPGVTVDTRLKYLDYLKNSVEFLGEARIDPSPEPVF